MPNRAAILSIVSFIALCFVDVPIASAEGPAFHVVKPGDTLWSLSIRYGVTLEALQRANGLIKPEWVFAGQVLVVPRNVVQNPMTHIVRPGDTVFSISNRYGVSAWALVQQNSIRANRIFVGQRLVISKECCSEFQTAPSSFGGSTALRARATPVSPKRLIVAKPYASGSIGYDVSYPQCNKALPTGPHSFIIVGINSGRAFRHNHCFAALYDWASSTSSSTPSIYMNLNYVVGVTAGNGLNGPAGRCGTRDETCKAYNYGYNAAKDAFEHAGARTAKMWWLDIEMANTWSTSGAMNGQVIQGAIDFFQNRSVLVGIYSSPNQWRKIVGSFRPRHLNQAVLPIWIAWAANHAKAPSFCSSEYAFGGGTPWIIQYPSNGFDGAYVC